MAAATPATDLCAMCAEAGGRRCETPEVGAPCQAACSAQARLEEAIGLDLTRRLLRALAPLQGRRGSSSPRIRTKRKMPNPATPATTREIALVQPIAIPPTKM